MKQSTCQQYGHTGGTRGRLGVERWQLCLRDKSRSEKCLWGAAVGHWVSLCVRSDVGWLILYQLGILCSMYYYISLSCSQYSQTICWRGWDDNACLVRNTCSIRAWPNSLDWRPPWYCIVCYKRNSQIKGISGNADPHHCKLPTFRPLAKIV